MDYVTPLHKEKRFNCAFCNAFADQYWSVAHHSSGSGFPNIGFETSQCASCNRISLWKNKQMIFPDIITAPLPNQDMPKEIRKDFEESRSISTKSSKVRAHY